MKDKRCIFLTAAELAAAAALIVFDVLIPAVLVLVLAAVSLLIRREKPSDLGLKKLKKPLQTAAIVFGLTIAWTLIDAGLFMPVLNRLTGTVQDLSAYENLKGDIGQYLYFLAAGWTLAAVVEEIAFRGYIQERLSGLFKNRRAGIIAAVAVSSLLFGLIHTEQGMVGVVITALDAVFFSIVKIKFENNTWASVLAHGFSNTIGITVFFFTGPIYGLW